MSQYQPTIRIAAKGSLCVIGLTGLHGTLLSVTPRMAVVPEAALFNLSVRLDEVGRSYQIRLVTAAADNGPHYVLADVQFADALSAEQGEQERRALLDALSTSYTEAVFGFLAQTLPSTELLPAAMAPQHVAGPATAGVAPATVAGMPSAASASALGGRLVRGLRWLRRNKIKSAAVAVGLASMYAVAYGYVTKPAEQTAFSTEMSPESQKALEAKIRERVKNAAAGDGVAIAGLDGQSVAIGTMKAMGLDPGKASAGCLVGVKR